VLVFVGESGHPLPGDPNPWSTLVAVCVPETASRDVSRRLFGKTLRVYGGRDPDGIELKASKLLNRRQFDRNPQRQAMVEELLHLFEVTPLSVFATRMRRPAIKPNWPAKRVDPPTRLLVERVELHMRNEHPGHYAKLIFDETDFGVDAARSAALRKFLHQTDEGRSVQQILDVPFFVASNTTPGIQLADIMAGALRHYQTLRDERRPLAGQWETTIERFYTLAGLKSHDQAVGPRTFPGLYTMPDNYYVTPPWRGKL
jgi:Protein of unknown function (DUF3800)